MNGPGLVFFVRVKHQHLESMALISSCSLTSFV
jgi:hypothetical protein